MNNVVILGSTGSIGTQTLNVIRKNRDKFNVLALTTNSNIELLYTQVMEFSPGYISITDKKALQEAKESGRFKNVKILEDNDSFNQLASLEDADTIIYSTLGFSCLDALLIGIKKKKRVCVANKEMLVTAGKLIQEQENRYSNYIFPIDSEHSAIWQCLFGENKESIEKLIITASGGAFRDLTRSELKNVKAKDALKHPVWSMGKKITIDSATLVNKGFEVIEARWLFDLPLDRIDAVIHKESVVHSLVAFKDGSLKAQLGYPSMEIPILLAMSYPNRLPLDTKRFDLIGKNLTFDKIDEEKYRCFSLCKQALRDGGLYPTILNAANDILVEEYLKDNIAYLDIEKYLEKALNDIKSYEYSTKDEILEKDKEVRDYMYSILK